MPILQTMCLLDSIDLIEVSEVLDQTDHGGSVTLTLQHPARGEIVLIQPNIGDIVFVVHIGNI